MPAGRGEMVVKVVRLDMVVGEKESGREKKLGFEGREPCNGGNWRSRGREASSGSSTGGFARQRLSQLGWSEILELAGIDEVGQ